MYSILFVSTLLFFTSFAKEYQAVDELDLNKYVGKWYETYGNDFDKIFQGNGKCSTAKYELLDNGKVSVLNKQLDKNDNLDEITGYAYYKEGDGGGYLTVSLKGTPEAPYWVLELGPVFEGYYDYSIVSDDKALSLFVLTRDVDRFYKLYDTIVLDSLKELGFDKKFNSPQTMNQTDCFI